MPCILAIDDNEDILGFLREILHNYGYHVLTAPSGKRGLKLLLQERVDLVVLDREMPEMNGYDVAEAIRRQWPEIPLILYTGLPFDVPPKLRHFVGVVAKTNCAELLHLIAATAQREGERDHPSRTRRADLRATEQHEEKSEFSTQRRDPSDA